VKLPTSLSLKPAAAPGDNFDQVRIFSKKGQQIPIINHHCQLLATLSSSLKDQITIFDKKDKPVDLPRLQSVSSIALLRELVDLHTRTAGNVCHVSIKRVRTSLSVSEIRTTTGILRQLKDIQAQIQEHHFTINEWDITSVGWLHDLHPNHMSYKNIANHSNLLMLAAIRSSFPPETKIPFHRLSNCTPKYHADGHDDMQTKAIQISCSRSASKQLHKLLVKAYAGNPIYVPWTARGTNPT
jgi:hypothetical protein